MGRRALTRQPHKICRSNVCTRIIKLPIVSWKERKNARKPLDSTILPFGLHLNGSNKTHASRSGSIVHGDNLTTDGRKKYSEVEIKSSPGTNIHHDLHHAKKRPATLQGKRRQSGMHVHLRFLTPAPGGWEIRSLYRREDAKT